MNDTKPTLMSSTVWGALAALAGAAIPALFASLGWVPADQQAATVVVGQAVSAIGGAIALFGRLRATKRLT